jgi:hypothetical protein
MRTPSSLRLDFGLMSALLATPAFLRDGGGNGIGEVLGFGDGFGVGAALPLAIEGLGLRLRFF